MDVGRIIREREELRMTSGSRQRCRRKTGVIMAKEIKEKWSIVSNSKEIESDKDQIASP